MKYRPENQFTPQELQFLKSVFSIVLDGAYKEMLEMKAHANKMFDMCNPDDPESLEIFKVLNSLRNAIRKQKKNQCTLAAIQGKIKRKLCN